jgi:hypothetical protein
MVWRHEECPACAPRLGRGLQWSWPGDARTLGSELGRTLALTRANGNATAATELMLWDGVGLSTAQVAELAERSGVQVHASDAMTMLNLEPSAGGVAVGEVGSPSRSAQTLADSFAPALALAAAAADRALLPLDFTRSRLTPRRARRVGKQTPGHRRRHRS